MQLYTCYLLYFSAGLSLYSSFGAPNKQYLQFGTKQIPNYYTTFSINKFDAMAKNNY